MSLQKILDTDITANGVVSAPDKLEGTAAQNKAVFDKLIGANTQSVKARFNALIDALESTSGTTGASQIGASVNGLEGVDVQTLLNTLKSLIVALDGASVKTTAQSLTEEQKTQARDNIGVTSAQVAVNSVNGRTGAVTLAKTDVGLGDVDNHHSPKVISLPLTAASWVNHFALSASTTITDGTATVTDTFCSQVSGEGSYVFTYDSANSVWKLSGNAVTLATYGISYTGTPLNGNTITVVATDGYYTQTVTVEGSTANSKIDLQPGRTVINQLISDDVSALYIDNTSGTLTAYSLGEKPSVDLTIQATIREVI